MTDIIYIEGSKVMGGGPFDLAIYEWNIDGPSYSWM